jgi:hypothetical protein
MEDIDIIAKQTGITDKLEIRKCYFKNNKDMTNTIMELLGPEIAFDDKSNDKSNKTTQKNEFDEIRNIMNEKERIYHLKSKK